jgi:hypothetical protein
MAAHRSSRVVAGDRTLLVVANFNDDRPLLDKMCVEAGLLFERLGSSGRGEPLSLHLQYCSSDSSQARSVVVTRRI